MSEIKYRRIMLKVSGEALAGPAHRGLDFDVINSVCEAIKECVDMGVQVGLMVGAGNFWRCVKDGADKMQRSHADAMGMLGTVMNSIAVADALEKHGAFKGTILTVWRVLRCNPWSLGGIDYVPDKFSLYTLSKRYGKGNTTPVDNED